jgi:peroxiredoxin family protein
MSEDAAAAVSEIQAAIAAEVGRQIQAFREEMEGRLAEIRERTVDDRATLVVFSAELDKVLTAFVIATGAASAGLETSIFFTFWGLAALKRKGAAGGPKSVMERMLAMMTPGSTESMGLSKLNFFGAGAVMLRKMMKDKDIASLEDLVAMARDLDVKMIACTMSMDALGVRKDELIDGLEYGGVATYLADAARSRVTLFI